MNLHIIAAVVAAILLIWLVIKVFSTPIRWAFKLLINALLGFVMLFIFNFLGSIVGLTINIGWISAIIAGVLGVPGIILLLLIENFFM